MQRDAESNRTEIKQYADSLREEVTYVQSQQEIRHRVRKCIQAEAGEDLAQRYGEVVESGSAEQIANAFLVFKREWVLAQKTKKLSKTTLEQGRQALAKADELVKAKKTFENLHNQVIEFQAEKTQKELLPEDQIAVRKTILQYRHSIQFQQKCKKDLLAMLTAFSKQRNLEVAEEQSLMNSADYYLQFVEPAQRARLEVIIENKLESMSYERRIGAMHRFTETLLQTSPSILKAEVERLMELARYFRETGEPETAIDYLTRAARHEAEDARIYDQFGRCYQDLGDTRNCLRSYSHAAKLDPNNAEIQIAIAEVLKKNGNLKAAIQRYQTAYGLKPHSFYLLSHLARVTFENEWWEESIPYLREILRQKPSSRKTRRRLGIALVRHGESDEGISLIKDMIRHAGVDADLLLHLGYGYRAEGWYKDAFQAFQQAVKMEPENTEARLALAQGYFDRGAYEKAIAQCQSLHEKSGIKTNALILLYARLLRRLRRYEEALSLLRHQLKQTGQNSELLFEYGLCSLKDGNGETAYQTLHNLLPEKDADPELRQAYGEACILTGRFEEAAVYLTPQ
ncbi:tetratricopeptide repeat protein [bacterium]|nr:tetratricopeptide repeat protein [bacterium]